MRFADFLDVISGIAVITGLHNSNCIAQRQANAPYPSSILAVLQSTDAANIITMIDNIRQIINKNGDKNWLSTTRNMVSYNHQFGVWFPYASNSIDYDTIRTMQKLYVQSPMRIHIDFQNDNEIIKFIKTCQIINAMNHDVLSDLLSRHPDNKSFARKGYFSYFNMQCNDFK